MALIIANRDGTSNAKAGDTVVTGGGLYVKNEDGTSKFLSPLPTATGKTGSYDVVQSVFNSLNKNIGTTKKNGAIVPVAADQNVVVDTPWNYDSFTTPDYDPSDYASPSGSSVSGSTIAGYIIVGLVGLAVLDHFVGGSKKG